MYTLIAISLANLVTWPLASLFYIDQQQFRDLYQKIKNEVGLEFIRDWNNVGNGMRTKTFFAVVLFLLSCLISLYLPTIFYAIYKDQQSAWIIVMIMCLVVDWLVVEFFVELIIALLYLKRRDGEKWQYYSELMNRMRNVRMLG